METFDIAIHGVQIKGYHHFKINAPAGTPFTIQEEDSAYNPYALACYLANDVNSICKELRTKVMFSKSLKSYTLQDVKGSQIGRVQYFLNKAVRGMYHNGQISQMSGIVNGEPCLSTNPSSTQKFSRNKQAGGRACIPAILRIGPSIHAKLVLERICKTLCKCKNKEEMPVEML
ncbi:hypothetical protein P5673_018568 [Acropora cervicornis]|uniref:Uncharacterized protein n=1 Tax=Acropora cervicornis TaxID=6130 RepID=A0AAD9QCY2_ACRCE|nr:hypothetical protein P5673_018568 [Acropora cervicornis]